MTARRPGGRLLDRVANGLGGAVDAAVLAALRRRFTSSGAGRQSDHAVDRRALLAETIAFYTQPGILSGAGFFAAPPAPHVEERKHGPLPGGEVIDLRWESGFSPAWERAREPYRAHAPNRVVHARCWRHRGGAPGTILCLHGYRGGALFVEERAFSVRWLYRLGLDVALVALPFHGPRAGKDAPVWPSLNLVRANEGFGQAIYDLRALCGWLRGRSGGSISVCGMSLGGYTAALLATVEPLDLVALMIPVASWPDLLWSHGAGRPERLQAEREGITLEMLRAAMAVHTPVERRPLLDRERVLVMGAAGDRIAPLEHASRLGRHFGVEPQRLPGGHVLQLGRGQAFRSLARKMSSLGLLPPRA